VFKGYWNNPEATRSTFVEIDGKRWFRTGDLGRVDEDGYFFMVDRLKRMINASGFKVWPAEVEALMYQHPAIQEACVIGAKDPHRGETVKAVVVIKEPSAARSASRTSSTGPTPTWPPTSRRASSSSSTTLPKSGTGKVMWRALQETVIFTLEYVARLVCVRHPLRYATSFFGIVDLLAILPTYLALLVPEMHALIDVRVLRLLRVFRIFKLTAYLSEFQSLGSALVASRRKIMVFLSVVLMIVVVMGTLMYVVEGPANGFTSIPISVYWAITTITTVGFGDITPKTDLGRLIASMMMLLGWGTLAVPTGIVTSEMAAQRQRRPTTTRTCHECLTEGHAPDALYCMHCAAPLPPYQDG
jgi:voltage-gated potassium channel